jgi:hypothetical protein
LDWANPLVEACCLLKPFALLTQLIFLRREQESDDALHQTFILNLVDVALRPEDTNFISLGFPLSKKSVTLCALEPSQNLPVS